ncbi:MAG TPA: hypothetical protein VM143_14415 [Acidimicrobiales bacterium]|nr:hypothetical protein [Acidimicrobiales bacterium]
MTRPDPVALDEWLRADPARGVPHVDFGSLWIDPAEPDTHQRVSWIPDTGELYATNGTNVETLGRYLNRADVEFALAGWGEHGNGPDADLAWVRDAVADHAPLDPDPPGWSTLADVPSDEPFLTHAEATAARLQAWERDLQARERLLLGEMSPLDESRSATPVTLPAAPVASALTRLHADRYIGGEDPATFAEGLGIDDRLATGILAGEVTDLDAAHIAHVCEALHASPFDIWGPERGRQILDVYGPEKWPRHIEPLDDGRRLPGDDTFLRRRIEQQAAQLVLEPAGPVPAPWVLLEVTPYQQTGVLSVDANGSVTSVTDNLGPADPASDYHFTFQQVAEPQHVLGPMTAATFAAGCPAGHDAPPALAALAERLDHQRPGTDMFRFRDPDTGSEHWLGRDTPFDQWQTWDDPRSYYPGDPADVLDERMVDLTPTLSIDVRSVEEVVELEGAGLEF